MGRTGTQVASNSAKLSIIRNNYLYGVIDKEIFPKVTGTDQTNNPIAVVSDFFLRKATKTLDAMCVLCEAGFTFDALAPRPAESVMNLGNAAELARQTTRTGRKVTIYGAFGGRINPTTIAVKPCGR
jgi:hypothetical protein